MGIFDFFSRKQKDGSSADNNKLLQEVELAPGFLLPKAFEPY